MSAPWLRGNDEPVGRGTQQHPLRIAAEYDGDEWRIVVSGSIASPSAPSLAALLVSAVRNARMLTRDLSEADAPTPRFLHILISVRRMAQAH